MEEFIMTQEAFDRLWARVQGAEPAPMPARDDAAVLRGFLEQTWQTLAFETRLLCRSGCAQTALQHLCSDTRERLNRLRTAHFLLTGERCLPPETCPVCGDFLADLRKGYLSARKRASAYARAAQEPCPPELQELYAALSGEETAHAACIRRLIASLLRR